MAGYNGYCIHTLYTLYDLLATGGVIMKGRRGRSWELTGERKIPGGVWGGRGEVGCKGMMLPVT